MYQDPLLGKLIERLNADGPSALKNRYYIGDPLVLAESQLPICFVTKDTTSIVDETNIEDRHKVAVVLNVVYKFTKELNQKAFTQAGIAGLYDACEGRTADFALKSGTIAHVLRSNQTLDSTGKLYIDIDNVPTVIDYNISPPSRRGMFSLEAMIRTQLVLIQDSPQEPL